jgi:predicted NBD/HSP70 family sugar kinase
VRDGIAARIALPVRVDNNIRCFTHAVARFEPIGGSLLVVTIRSGIGVGIVVDGVVYQGEKGRAGELGHLRIDPDGQPCRCGRRGCLETLVNRSIIGAQARSLSMSIPEAFSAARAGNPEALAIVEGIAAHLGPALASLILVTDIQSIILSADFGPDGTALIDPLAERVAQELCPDMGFDLGYRELDDRSYVTGAAFLVLRDFVLR